MRHLLPRLASLLLTSIAVLSLRNPASAATAGACFPDCRAGYTCHEGQCVSLCNPGCEPGEVCTAVGTCEARSVAPPAPMVAAVPAPAPSPAPALTVAPVAAPIAKDESPETLKGASAKPGTFVLGLELGVALAGGGEVEYCGTAASNCSTPEKGDFSDKSRVSMAITGLFHISPRLRLGLGYTAIPYSAMAYDSDARTWHRGSEHAAHAVFEGLLPLGARTSLVGTFFAGPNVLLIGGDLDDASESFVETCLDAGADHCHSDTGPFVGYSYGTSIGVLMGRAPRFRLDLSVERFGYQSFERRATVGDSTYRSEESLSGARVWLLAGLEL